MTFVSTQRAILFADVTDSTAIYELLGDKPAARAIEACLTVLGAAVLHQGGVVVKTIGDEIMAAFQTAAAAFKAAMDMQAQVNALPASNGVKLAIKVGFHFGPVLEDRMDFWGDGVNTAARLAGLARRGQILTSSTTIDELTPELRSVTRDLDALSVKGKQEAVHVFEVVWRADLDSTQVVVPNPAGRAPSVLVLSRGAARIEFPPGKASLWLGRDPGCEIPVQEPSASRRHARIERRAAQYFLVDDSTNGTYLHIDGDEEVFFRREQVLLRGRGRIGLGASAHQAADAISFDCM